MADAKKEMKELMKALGMIGGEIHEVTKDGFGMEDLKSIIDLAKNFEVLKDGFSIPKLSKEDFDNLSQSDLVEIVMSAFDGFSLGKE